MLAGVCTHVKHMHVCVKSWGTPHLAHHVIPLTPTCLGHLQWLGCGHGARSWQWSLLQLGLAWPDPLGLYLTINGFLNWWQWSKTPNLRQEHA